MRHLKAQVLERHHRSIRSFRRNLIFFENFAPPFPDYKVSRES
jgi:hypothetical protein